MTRNASSKSVPFGNPRGLQRLVPEHHFASPIQVGARCRLLLFRQSSAHLKKFLLAVNLRVKKLYDFDRFLLWRMGFSELQKSPGKKSGVKPHAVPERRPNRELERGPRRAGPRNTPIPVASSSDPVQCSRIGAWPVRPPRVATPARRVAGRFIGTPSKVRFGLRSGPRGVSRQIFFPAIFAARKNPCAITRSGRNRKVFLLEGLLPIGIF